MSAYPIISTATLRDWKSGYPVLIRSLDPLGKPIMRKPPRCGYCGTPATGEQCRNCGAPPSRWP